MELTKELLEKAKTAKTAEELLEMAKAENIEMTEEQAAKAFADLHKTGELSDEELENATGGGCSADCCGATENGIYYTFTGDDCNPDDYNRAYLCPICGRPVHWGSWARWYCDPCDKHWDDEYQLKPNLNSGLWRVETEQEARKRKIPNPSVWD